MASSDLSGVPLLWRSVVIALIWGVTNVFMTRGALRRDAATLSHCQASRAMPPSRAAARVH
jgi:hypothetical protein